jgi:hypothetical protein
MKKLRAIPRGDTALAESSYRLQCFLGLLECEEIPEELFEHAARAHHIWGPTGDLTTAASLVPIWLRSLLEEEYGPKRPKTRPTALRVTLRDKERASWSKLRPKEISPEENERILFDILSTVMQSLPEPYTEILWQETTTRLWPVVHSTCLPFLAVIDLSDVRSYIASRSR